MPHLPQTLTVSGDQVRMQMLTSIVGRHLHGRQRVEVLAALVEQIVPAPARVSRYPDVCHKSAYLMSRHLFW